MIMINSNVVGDEESSTDGKDDEYHDNHQPKSNFYSNSGNESASEPNYQDNDANTNKSDNDSDAHSNNSDEVDNSVNQRRPPCMVGCLRHKGSDMGLDGNAWTHTNSILLAMMVTEQMGVRMMQEYFEIETSKSTPQCG